MLAHSMMYYKAHRKDDQALRQRMRDIAEARVRYGHELTKKYNSIIVFRGAAA
jgi:hypothetical protein